MWGYYKGKKIFLVRGCCLVGRVFACQTKSWVRFPALHEWYLGRARDPRTKEAEAEGSKLQSQSETQKILSSNNKRLPVHTLSLHLFIPPTHFVFLFLINIQSHCAFQRRDSSQIRGSLGFLPSHFRTRQVGPASIQQLLMEERV